MELSKLILVVEKPGKAVQFNDKDASRCIEAMFNPNKLTVSRSAQWQNQQAAKRDNPELQYTGAEPATLAIDLFFDTYDTPSEEKDSVRQYTDRLRLLTLVDGEKHRPPVCQLRWGKQGLLFQGVLTQIETQYTLFMGNGTPVRATNRCTFKQWQSNEVDLKGQNLLSSDVAKVWVVKQGQTLAAIAAHEYGDPREWRAIAEANDIDDPLALVPGRRLLLPARRADRLGAPPR